MGESSGYIKAERWGSSTGDCNPGQPMHRHRVVVFGGVSSLSLLLIVLSFAHSTVLSRWCREVRPHCQIRKRNLPLKL